MLDFCLSELLDTVRRLRVRLEEINNQIKNGISLNAKQKKHGAQRSSG